MRNSKLVLVLFVMICALPVFAQSDQSIDVFAGYSYASNFDTSLNGWIVSGNYNFPDSWLGLEGEISGHYGTNHLGISGLPLPIPSTALHTSLHNYDFGPRVTFRNPDDKFDAFGHFLLGASHARADANGVADSDTSFSWVLGGGGDYNINERWAGRAQLDLLRTDFFSNGQSHPRLSVGIVYRFGSR